MHFQGKKYSWELGTKRWGGHNECLMNDDTDGLIDKHSSSTQAGHVQEQLTWWAAVRKDTKASNNFSSDLCL